MVSPYIGHFMNIAKYNSANYYFAQTRFHDYFYELIENKIEKLHGIDENCIIGVKGIGITTTLVYYVITCIKKGIKNIHYIDLNLVKGETQMNRLKKYAEEMKSSSVLILDHVTLFNRSIVADIKSLVPMSKIIYVKSGFSATRNQFDKFIGYEWELTHEEFRMIWMESMRKPKHTANLQNQEIFITKLYDTCKDKYILTPRLLHKVHVCFVIDGDQYSPNEEDGKDVDYFIMRYRSSLGKDITEFRLRLLEMMECGKLQQKYLCSELSLHSKILLNQVKITGGILLNLERNCPFKIPVNIFHCKYGIVKEKDIEKDTRFLENGFQNGDKYVNVTITPTELLKQWEKLFPFDVHSIIENKDAMKVENVLDICFHSEGIRKEMENELVRLQYQLRTLIIPGDIRDSTSETHCKVSDVSVRYVLPQCQSVAIVSNLREITYINLTASHLENVAAKLKCQGGDRNVEKMAYFLRNEIEKNIERCLIVHPTIDILKGFDYILYNCTETRNDIGAKKPKKARQESFPILHLVQLTTGDKGTSRSVAESLKVLKSVMDGFVHLHMTIIIASKDCQTYTFNGNVNFENVSVVNLTHLAIGGMIKQSKLLNSIVGMVKRS
ncbi:unnamed protein product [Mytilus edulis]|uniref:Uncharacterized protein n=1 Tax=Mytilus edulis TaxID=6550 RepID=A0A8S3VCA8_MYTED|nr:unnamed protein product [Mytilus edulis]